MQDGSIQQHITELVNEEHALRRAVQDGKITTESEQTRLRELEVELDQCWDLLRRRRAARDNHEDPERLEVRSPAEVEGYRQ